MRRGRAFIALLVSVVAASALLGPISAQAQTPDELDQVDNNPAGAPECTTGTTGPRIELHYIIPNGHEDRWNYRELELHDFAASYDRMLNYATGPWRDMNWRWYCENGNITVTKETGIPSVSQGVKASALWSWMDQAGWYQDGNIHVAYVEMSSSQCFVNDDLSCPGSRAEWAANRSSVHGAATPFTQPYSERGYMALNPNSPISFERFQFVRKHELTHVAMGAPDIYSIQGFNPDYGEDDEMDIMGAQVRYTGALCGRVQMDCGKEEWFSSLEAHTNNTSWTGQFNNSAISVYATAPVSTEPTVYCVGSVVSSSPKLDEAADTWTGTSAAEIVTALDQNDWIDGQGGNDKLCGGDGSDVLKGGPGNDVISGSAGLDDINGGDGDDVIYDGWARDTISGGPGFDIVYLCNDTAADVLDGSVEATGSASDANCKNRNFELSPY